MGNDTDKTSKPAKRAPGTSGDRRRTLEQVAGSTSSLLLIVIVLMLNYLSFRNYERIDWTSQSLFTLSDKSHKVLSGLGEDIDIYLFMSQGEPNFDDTKELLQRYQDASSHIQVHFVDPDREQGEFEVLAQRFGIVKGLTETGESMASVAAVVARGETRWHVSRDDLIGWSMGPIDGEEELNIKAEQAMTGAIVQVTSGRATKVCITSGHGEWSTDEAGERTLALLQTFMSHDNIEWQDVPTLGKKALPEGCDAVLVLGPVRAFSEPEAKLLDDYLRGGGNLLVALDPVIEHDEFKETGLEAMLHEHGVRPDRSLVVELNPERLLTPNTLEFMTTDFGDHVTTRPFQAGARVIIPFARSLSATGKNQALDVLVRTSGMAFGATDISRVMADSGSKEPARGAGDLEGPLDLAYAVRVGVDPDEVEEKPGGRLIVVGDSDFLAPALLQAPELANFHLVSSWIGWLTAREALIEIPPKKVASRAIIFTQDDLWGLLFRVVVLLPGAALLMGVAIYLNRRA